jgi:anti-sigma B factor antagonist
MVQIDIIKENDITTLNINGEVDASSSIQLDESLGGIVSNGDPIILINCGGLNYISSAGLGVFMSYIEDVNAKNIKMALYGLNDKVMNVFEILGLDQLLTIVNTKKEALSRINEV